MTSGFFYVMLLGWDVFSRITFCWLHLNKIKDKNQQHYRRTKNATSLELFSIPRTKARAIGSRGRSARIVFRVTEGIDRGINDGLHCSMSTS